MPLTALEIYKYLPKKNCGECNVPTCLAFAMQLAAMKIQLEKCPYVSEDAKNALAAAAAPPIKLVKIGTGDDEVEIGNEVVLHRHEKTFYHPTAFAMVIEDSLDNAQIEKEVSNIQKICYERIGMIIKLNMVAIQSRSDEKRFGEVTELIASKTNLPLILMTENATNMECALKKISKSRPLIHCATEDNFERMADLAKQYNSPLAVRCATLDKLADLTQKIKAKGVDDLVLDICFEGKRFSKVLEELTKIRRLAIKKTYRPLGYPTMGILDYKTTEENVMAAGIGIMKYASILVFKSADPSQLYPLLTLRQNIYTDPQKPIQVKPGLYEIGKTSSKSPVMFTTNFSLTYFTVEGDIEKSKIPSYLLVIDTEGLSVMTSFAAGKLTPELVAKYLEDYKASEKVEHKKIIIPGMVARMSMKLKELSGWDVLVGPRDSAGIPSFMKTSWTV